MDKAGSSMHQHWPVCTPHSKAAPQAGQVLAISSAIHVLTIIHAQNDNRNDGVLNAADDAKVAYPVTP